MGVNTGETHWICIYGEALPGFKKRFGGRHEYMVELEKDIQQVSKSWDIRTVRVSVTIYFGQLMTAINSVDLRGDITGGVDNRYSPNRGCRPDLTLNAPPNDIQSRSGTFFRFQSRATCLL